MPDSRFSVLKYNGKIPMLACCLRCQLKFLTPKAMMFDREEASTYLERKYADHHCTVFAIQGRRGFDGSSRI